MRSLLTLSLAAALAAPLSAQADDYAGLRIFTPTAFAPTPIPCGAIVCTPDSLTATPGELVTALVQGVTGGIYFLAASLDVANLGCLNLAAPGLFNELTLPPGSSVLLSFGTLTQSDNGRCNGGAELIPLFTIPQGITGALAFQAASDTPLSTGGDGLALSNTVIMNF